MVDSTFVFFEHDNVTSGNIPALLDDDNSVLFRQEATVLITCGTVKAGKQAELYVTLILCLYGCICRRSTARKGRLGPRREVAVHVELLVLVLRSVHKSRSNHTSRS